jgi:protein required for attachment to host cells
MTSDGSPLALLAQQGVEVANLIVAEKSVSEVKHDRARHDRSEAASSASPNWHLAENDAHRCITQNHNTREYGRNQDDLRNVIEDWRRI